jgi:hypothetical protein
MGLRFQNAVYTRLVHLPMLCAACGGVAQSKMLLSQLLSAKHNQFVSLVGSAPCSLLVPEVDMLTCHPHGPVYLFLSSSLDRGDD